MDSGDGKDMAMTDLRSKGAPPTKCPAGKCKLSLSLDTTAVYLFAPPALASRRSQDQVHQSSYVRPYISEQRTILDTSIKLLAPHVPWAHIL